MIFLQLISFCTVFTLAVRVSVIGGAVNGLYFYPRDYQKTAFDRKIADPEITATKRKRFMIPFIVVMLVTLLLIVGLWNRAVDFKTAYLQSLLFLEVMNWYDGIVIDRMWVGHSPFWVIPGMEDTPYVQSWKQVLKKRGILTLVWVPVSVIPAEIIVLLG